MFQKNFKVKSQKLWISLDKISCYDVLMRSDDTFKDYFSKYFLVFLLAPSKKYFYLNIDDILLKLRINFILYFFCFYLIVVLVWPPKVYLISYYFIPLGMMIPIVRDHITHFFYAVDVYHLLFRFNIPIEVIFFILPYISLFVFCLHLLLWGTGGESFVAICFLSMSFLLYCQLIYYSYFIHSNFPTAFFTSKSSKWKKIIENELRNTTKPLYYGNLILFARPSLFIHPLPNTLNNTVEEARDLSWISSSMSPKYFREVELFSYKEKKFIQDQLVEQSSIPFDLTHLIISYLHDDKNIGCLIHIIEIISIETIVNTQVINDEYFTTKYFLIFENMSLLLKISCMKARDSILTFIQSNPNLYDFWFYQFSPEGKKYLQYEPSF